MRLHSGPGRFLWFALFAVLLAGAGWSLLARRRADPDQLWKAAEDDFRAGRCDQAEAGLARVHRLRAPTAVDLLLEAQLAMYRGHIDAAVAALAKVPDQHPLAPEARLRAGQLEMRRDRLGAAEALLKEAVGLDPKRTQAHRELIYIYGMQLRRLELDNEFRALSELAPLTFENVWHWGLTRNNHWEALELRGHLERFLKADPDDRATRIALAECLRRLQKYDEAETTLAALPAAADPEARAVRVRIALDRGDDATAEALLTQGPADHPDLALLSGRLALARSAPETALRHFQSAYAAQPDNRETIGGMANALARLGRAADAAPFLTAARRYDAFASLLQRASTRAGRDDPELPRQLGAACEAIGRLPEARAWYSLVIARDPVDPDAQQALFRIAQRAKLSPEVAGKPR